MYLQSVSRMTFIQYIKDEGMRTYAKLPNPETSAPPPPTPHTTQLDESAYTHLGLPIRSPELQSSQMTLVFKLVEKSR
jgi:hypothetical protein